MSNRMLLVYFVICLVGLHATPRLASACQSPTCNARELAAEVKPDSAIYSDAVDLAKTLIARGFVVKCMLHSTAQGMFKGLSGSALYRTNRGDFEALFLPKPKSFDAFEVIEEQENGRFIYSFRGTPPPYANRIDTSRQEYFIKQSNRLLIVHGDAQLAETLRQVLSSS